MLKDIHGPTMAQAGYQHANHLASEIRIEIRDRNQMVALMKTFSNQQYEKELQEDNNLYTTNTATQMSVQQETIKALIDLEKQLQSLASDVKHSSKPTKNRYKNSRRPAI